MDVWRRNEPMSDLIFIGATIAFFAICALYVNWCDKIIGPDDFPAAGTDSSATVDDAAPVLIAAATSRGVEE
jgi:hypothetical protein